MIYELAASANTLPLPRLTGSLGCVLVTCHAVAFPLGLFALVCVVLLLLCQNVLSFSLHVVFSRGQVQGEIVAASQFRVCVPPRLHSKASYITSAALKPVPTHENVKVAPNAPFKCTLLLADS